MKDSKARKTLATIGKIFIALSLMTMVLMVFVNAVDRYFFKDNIPVFEELSRYLFVWVAFLGAMLGYAEGKHVGVDIVVNKLHGVTKLIVTLIAEALIFTCVTVLGHGAWVYFSLTWSDPSPSSRIPYGMVSGMAIVLAVFLFAVTVRDVVKTIKAYKNGELDIVEDKIKEMEEEYGIKEE